MVKVITFSRCALVAIVVAGSMACVRPALAADGYDGVMAAPADDKDTPAKAGNEASPGYNGVVADPSATEQADTPNQYSTPVPGSRGPIRDLRTAAMVHGLVENAPAIRPPNVDFSATRHNLIAGKPATEYMAEQHIAQAMSSINNKNISDNERALNAKKAYQNLATLADGLRSKQATPDDTYKSMGLTDAYINDERNGNAAALTHLDSALATLKPYQ